jgi:hypothetical protein
MTALATVDLFSAGPPGAPELVEHHAGQHLLVCRATVQQAEMVDRIVLFMPSPGSEVTLASLAAAIAAEPAGTIGVLVRDGGEGQIAVEIRRDQEPRAFPIAAATAVMRASWGWEESRTVHVSVNAIPQAIAPRDTRDGWAAIATDAV